jgi:gamma-glutamyl-gamma-aminobutyrate hydrolase PuuD
MKTIAISMGQQFIKDRNETIDFIDKKLIEFVSLQLNYEVILISNFIQKNLTKQKKNLNLLLQSNKIKGIILSGGQDVGTNKLRDKTEITLIDFAIKNKIPLIGICRGMQLINFYFKGELKKVTGHVANTVKIYSILTKKKREVKCFHSNGIKKIGKNLIEIYRSDDGTIEAFKGEKHRILGVMWHPERNQKLSTEDIKLFTECLKN